MNNDEKSGEHKPLIEEDEDLLDQINIDTPQKDSIDKFDEFVDHTDKTDHMPLLGSEPEQQPFKMNTPQPNMDDQKKENLTNAEEAKLDTLKQMFQDIDSEVLFSILMEQSNGDLDTAIQAILDMQNADKTFQQEPSPTKKAVDFKDLELVQSQLVPVYENEQTESTLVEVHPEEEQKQEPLPEIDQKTQELIDELIAEDTQLAAQYEQEMHLQRVIEQQVLEADLKTNTTKIGQNKKSNLIPEDEYDDEVDVFDQIKKSFKQKFPGLFKKEEKKQLENVQENSQTFDVLDKVEDEELKVSEYAPSTSDETVGSVRNPYQSESEEEDMSVKLKQSLKETKEEIKESWQEFVQTMKEKKEEMKKNFDSTKDEREKMAEKVRQKKEKAAIAMKEASEKAKVKFKEMGDKFKSLFD